MGEGSKKKVRLIMKVSPEFRERIESIRDATGEESMADVVRSAVAAYGRMAEMSQAGGSGGAVQIIGPDGRQAWINFCRPEGRG